MKCPPASPVETERLAALSEYELGKNAPLPSLDPVVRIAARMFGMPVAAVNMIGSDHVFFAAATGFDGADVDMSRDASFCAHAILQDKVMIVPDATLDARFHDNPLVSGPTHVRFYAGVPILSAQGYPLGALCVIDTKPNPDFSAQDAQRLRELASMATDRLELRRIELSSERVAVPAHDPEWQAPTAMIRFDSRGIILDWNESAAALYGYDLAEGPGRPLEMLAPERGRNAQRELIALAAAAGSLEGIPVPSEVRGLRRDGTEFPLGFSLFCWREEGRLIFNAHFQDLSALRHEKELLRQLANTDVLTGVANRTHFYRRAQAAVVDARPAAVIMVDLDGFKDIHDTLGHPAGDTVLREVAQRLLQLVQPQDTVARMGADEFALLLPGVTDVDEARRIAQAAAQAMFTSLSSQVTGLQTDSLTSNVTVSDNGLIRTATVTFSANSLVSFGGIIGHDTLAIGGSSTASASLPPNIDFYLLLDDSPSMGIAATSTGIATMVAHTSAQGGCAFACHESRGMDPGVCAASLRSLLRPRMTKAGRPRPIAKLCAAAVCSLRAAKTGISFPVWPADWHDLSSFRL